MLEEYRDKHIKIGNEINEKGLSAYGCGIFNVGKIFTPNEDLSEPEKLYFFLRGDTPKEKKASLEGWIAALKTCKRLKVCRFKNPTLHQEMFDALCGVKTLECLQLDTYRSRVESLEAVSGHPALTHIQILSSPRLTDLSSLASMPVLKALALEGNFGTHDLTSLAGMTSLEGLDVGGRYGKNWMIESLGFISKLPNLRQLGLGYFEVADKSLRAVLEHPRLEYLSIFHNELKRFPLKEYQRLLECRPDLKFLYLEPVAKDVAFQKKHKIK